MTSLLSRLSIYRDPEMTPLKIQAIQTALVGDWETAIILNQELLKTNPDDIETLNRLAYAFTIIGKTRDAKNTYKKVLELDTQNPIALKNLKRLGTQPSTKYSLRSSSPIPFYNVKRVGNMFIEESGKTKVIDLLNIADPKIVSLLRTGESLTLCVKRLKIFVLNAQDKYIGMLPEDIGKRLIKFLHGGNQYEAYVKAAENHRVTAFIKETKRAQRFKNQPSFIQTTDKNQFVIEKNSQLKQKNSDIDNSFQSTEDDSL